MNTGMARLFVVDQTQANTIINVGIYISIDALDDWMDKLFNNANERCPFEILSSEPGSFLHVHCKSNFILIFVIVIVITLSFILFILFVWTFLGLRGVAVS